MPSLQRNHFDITRMYTMHISKKAFLKLEFL